jgi:hypothetical protein
MALPDKRTMRKEDEMATDRAGFVELEKALIGVRRSGSILGSPVGVGEGMGTRGGWSNVIQGKLNEGLKGCTWLGRE